MKNWTVVDMMPMNVLVEVVMNETFEELGVPSFVHHLDVVDMTPLLERYTAKLGVEVRGNIHDYINAAELIA